MTPEDATILVVEDDPITLRSIVRMLEFNGVKVVESSNPIGVSALMRRHEPSLVVLDVDLPAISGQRLADSIRSTFERQIPIVFYSGLDDRVLYELFRAIPGSTYVTKSEGLPALWAAITRALRIAPANSGTFATRPGDKLRGTGIR